MSNFTHIGRVVTHTARPRFRVVFSPTANGDWEAGEIEWLDEPPAKPAGGKRETDSMVKFVARLLREAADYFHDHCHDDWIQAAVIARVAELGLSAYAIAQATGWAVSDDHVQAYLQRRKSMGSHKLQHVLAVLGIDLSPRIRTQ